MPNLQKHRSIWITFHFLFGNDIIVDIPSTSKNTYNSCIQELFLQSIITNVKLFKKMFRSVLSAVGQACSAVVRDSFAPVTGFSLVVHA